MKPRGFSDQWVGNTWVSTRACRVCYQPECSQSKGGTRPAAASHSTKLGPHDLDYRGYDEWALHPDHASFVLHRGYAIVNGERRHVSFIHNEAYVTQIKVHAA